MIVDYKKKKSQGKQRRSKVVTCTHDANINLYKHIDARTVNLLTPINSTCYLISVYYSVYVCNWIYMLN